MKKTKTLHRHLHPIHWHGSMILAIAAIMLTSMKSSSAMLRALQAVPTRAAVMDSVSMRDPETEHPPLILNFERRYSMGGK